MEKEKMTGLIMIVSLCLGIFGGGTFFGMLITMQPQENCPDCNLICPDVIDYGEDYDEVLEDMLRRLNDNKNISHTILGKTDGIDYDMTNIRVDLDILKQQLEQIQDQLTNKWPEDFIHAEVVNTSCIEIEYYDNFFDQHMGGTIYTFCADNWTDFIIWIQNQPPGTFSQYQINYLMLMAINLAYYKETGTWLGE